MNNPRKGLTLVELMVAMTIFTIALLTFAAVMGGVSKAIRINKVQTLANNLAQEKVESLKNLSYYRLLVTTSTILSTESGLDPFYYDDSYYPSEDLYVGQIKFTRRVNIQKVTETGTAISANNWSDADEGLKLITVSVLWQNGTTWKKISVSNLRDNPNRLNLNASFSGNVKCGTTNLQDVKVLTLQNPLYRAMTDASGNYTFKVPAGDYDVQASKLGYFTSTLNSTATTSGTNLPFNLTLMGRGSVSGIVYLDIHLLLSEICAAVGTDDQNEYVELYNPTSIPFTISSGGNPTYMLTYKANGVGSDAIINPVGQMYYVNSIIPANGYFLIASTPTVNGVVADAYYSNGTIANVPANRIPIGLSGGIALSSLGTYDTYGSTIDALGWGKSGGSPYGPAAAREGNGYHFTGTTEGFALNESLERMGVSSSTAVSMAAGGVDRHTGNAYDTDANESNWVYSGAPSLAQNSSYSELPYSGTPAVGAIASINDKLSASALALSVVPGSCTVTNVATGTWTVLISSRGWVYLSTNVVVTPNAVTTVNRILISTPATSGYASGRVVTSAGVPIQSILVTGSGAQDTTDSNGFYRLSLDIGTYTVVANPENNNTLYTVGQSTGVMINLGEMTDVSDITIYQGGGFRGFITTNGTDALPGIPIIATASLTSAELGSAISDSQGVFTFADVPAGSYYFTPQLETGESASPSSVLKTVISGTTVFVGTITITNAFGTLQGAASTTTGGAINTGVLIVAVVQPTAIGANPPTIDSTLRSGSVYYYMGSADSQGNYSISLRGGVTYNVYAWYTPTTNGVPGTPVKRTTTATITAGSATTKDFSW